ncbi:lipoyl synthase [Candidatus Woesearchaeota archaeon]|nr:lipoyl synthase [Candidatus Woesearchaeota archaeon]
MITAEVLEKPEWLKIQPPKGEAYSQLKQLLEANKLNTVCEEAHCPNMAECWSTGTATFMVLGKDCTRACKFCAVSTMIRPSLPDPNEPKNLAKAIKELNLRYIVLTSVNRDDLPDQGSTHIASCIQEIKKLSPSLYLEVLIPDFQGDLSCLQRIVRAQPDVIAHNLETVKRLQRKVRDLKASYDQSLAVLEAIKKLDPAIYTKSSLMLGLGETDQETIETMQDLREKKVDILTLGQYLRPGKRHLPVDAYIPPEKFEMLKLQAYKKGFKYAASGPFIRSSYKAAELFIEGVLNKCQ